MSGAGTEPRRCPSCSAEASLPEARFCEQCGKPLDPFGDVAARFAALATHPELAPLLAGTPEVPELAGKLLPSVVLLLLLVVVGGIVSLFTFSFCPPLGFVPAALVAFSVYALSKDLVQGARTPLVARPALVLAQRTQLQAGAERSPAHARHFVMLQFQDGARTEVECYRSAAGTTAVGELGVAYLKGERLAAFARVAV